MVEQIWCEYVTIAFPLELSENGTTTKRSDNTQVYSFSKDVLILTRKVEIAFSENINQGH